MQMPDIIVTGDEYDHEQYWRIDLKKLFNHFDIIFPPSWKIERIIWIAFEKNRHNHDCLLAKLPKDIVTYIVNML